MLGKNGISFAERLPNDGGGVTLFQPFEGLDVAALDIT
jgi:hypothetical protein